MVGFKDKRVDGIENELVVVKGNVAVLEMEKSKLKENYSKLEQRNAESIVKIDKLEGYINILERKDEDKDVEIKLIKQQLEMLLAKKESIVSDLMENTSSKILNNGLLTAEQVCKESNIKGLQQTQLKHFLTKKYGIYNVKINDGGDSFTLKLKDNKELPSEIKDMCIVDDKWLKFKAEFVDYLNQNSIEIKEVITEYRRKNKKYRDVKQKLDKANTKNYSNEITKICGETKYNDYKGDRYGMIYDVVTKDYPNWIELREEYIKANKNNPKYRLYEITRLSFLIEQMGLKNYLLKVACDLFA